jgi:hypothetical protein
MRIIPAALIGALLLSAAIPAGAQTLPRRAPAGPPVSAVPPDAATVDAIIAALYASVSHAADASPDFDRMRGIFLYTGMLIPPRGNSPEFTALDVDQFAERVKKGMEARKGKGDSTGFFEKEIARRTDCFGNVCQVFSTYESRYSASDAKPFIRGINSIQLLKDGRRWWIASVVWDTERPDNPIPPEYLSTARP